MGTAGLPPPVQLQGDLLLAAVLQRLAAIGQAGPQLQGLYAGRGGNAANPAASFARTAPAAGLASGQKNSDRPASARPDDRLSVAPACQTGWSQHARQSPPGPDCLPVRQRYCQTRRLPDAIVQKFGGVFQPVQCGPAGHAPGFPARWLAGCPDSLAWTAHLAYPASGSLSFCRN